MNKKIGILTYHSADNLGAALQAYALRKAINKTGKAAAQIIDYRCDFIEKTKRVAKPAGLKSLIKYLPMCVYYGIKGRGFAKFRREELPLSEKVYTPRNIAAANSEYDAFVTGSDQVFNLECSGWDYGYFLDFVQPDKKKYSYAASLGVYRFTEEEQARVKTLLADFSTVSVRENSAKEYFEQTATAAARTDLDPVFLLEKQDWENIMSGRLCSEKYILVYLIQQDVNVMNNAVRYAKETGCKIISNKKSIEFILRNNPRDFLSWVYHADCIFTNSFHGTAFGLIFNRPMQADIRLKNGGTNNRVAEVLSLMGAEKCILRKDDIQAFSPQADHRISQEREKALQYIDCICADD